MKETLQWIVDNSWLLPILYEVAVRLFPSEKSLSLINAIKQVVDFVLPNLKKDKETGDITKHK